MVGTQTLRTLCNLPHHHCEELDDDAIHVSASDAMDCFASHAMTMWRHEARQNNPTGKSAKTCPAPCAKIFRLTRRANQRYQLARPARREGRFAIVTSVRRDAVDA